MVGVWDQFLIGKRQMLADYRQAQAHSRELQVQTHHGVVGEAAVRSWLESFLPRRFGVTSGYIRGQRLKTRYDFAHFDVIVYDRIESPILWIESNPDKSPLGRKRIIPAEHVRAVFEIKAAFHHRTVEEAIAKLNQLGSLMASVDADDEKYPTYLPRNTVLVMLFFELRQEHKNDLAALRAFMKSGELPRVTYGPVILSGEGRSEDDTGSVRLTAATEPMDAFELPDGLLEHLYMSATTATDGQNLGAMLTWSPMNFADFAFDLLALMNGTYQHGRVSSFHGYDLGENFA